MSFPQILLLLSVSAIWGSSHSLIKVAVPEWGSMLTTFLRLSIATVVLMAFAFVIRKKIFRRENFQQYLIIALLNASFPIFLFAYAAKFLPASYLVILNATVPIFNATFSSIFLKDPFTTKKMVGILLGMAGIILLEGQGTVPLTADTWIASACALFASACYGMSAVYLKMTPRKIEPLVLTAGSSGVGSLLILPFTLGGNWHFASGAPLMAVLGLGVLGSAAAFILYYKLLAQVGPFKASLTTFLMPVFGLFWGWLLLGETANPSMLLGVTLIISATSMFLSVNKSVKKNIEKTS